MKETYGAVCKSFGCCIELVVGLVVCWNWVCEQMNLLGGCYGVYILLAVCWGGDTQLDDSSFAWVSKRLGVKLSHICITWGSS